MLEFLKAPVDNVIEKVIEINLLKLTSLILNYFFNFLKKVDARFKGLYYKFKRIKVVGII